MTKAATRGMRSAPTDDIMTNTLTTVLPSCPLCNGTTYTDLARYPQLVWVRCACGLIYKRDALATPDAQQDYEADYFGSGGEQGRRYDARSARRVTKSRHQILDALNHTEPGPLLDIGCSLGYTLVAARELGLAATGADVSKHAIETCRELGFRAERGLLGALPFADGEFAVVTMKHVLEHTSDPRAALADVRRVLRPGGALFIAVPDARYGKSVRNPVASRYYRPEAHGVEHFVYYTPATLSRLLEDTGFRVERVDPHLWHRRAPAAVRMLQLGFAPLRWLAQRVANGLALRKEFWLVAKKTG
jgi:SAM-dependent methyltransferase